MPSRLKRISESLKQTIRFVSDRKGQGGKLSRNDWRTSSLFHTPVRDSSSRDYLADNGVKVRSKSVCTYSGSYNSSSVDEQEVPLSDSMSRSQSCQSRVFSETMGPVCVTVVSFSFPAIGSRGMWHCNNVFPMHYLNSSISQSI